MKNLASIWKFGLGLAMVVLMSPSWACQVTSGPTSVTIPAGTKVNMSAAAGAIVWQSSNMSSTVSCAGPVSYAGRYGVSIQDYFNDSGGATDIATTQLNAEIIWSLNPSFARADSGSPSGTTSFNSYDYRASFVVGVSQNTVEPQPYLDGYTQYTGVLTWQIRLKKGTAATTVGMAALPNRVAAMRLNGVDSSQAVFSLVGLDTVRMTPSTCSISAPAVTMRATSTGSMMVAGSTGADAPFSIRLSGCTDDATGAVTNGRNVRAYFDGPMVDTTSGRLNLADTARNMQIQLRNATSQTVINLGGASGGQNVDTTQINGGAATLSYLARYYATGRTTAGPANSRVNFTLEYP